MKRFAIIIMCVITLCCLSACNKAESTQTRSEITVNLPSDNTVNGYRTESKSETVTSSNKTNSSKESSVTSQTQSQENQSVQYCGNIGSKKFHISSCGSVATIKEENRLYLSDRNELINLGYEPCKRCNP